MIKTLLAALFLCLSLPLSAAGKVELLMFEEDGCIYCQKFHKEVGSAYRNSTEGKLAPLRRLDLHQPLPKDVKTINGKVEISPTFMLVVDGKEVDRMFGYQGDEFFWVHLQNLFERLPQEFNYKPSI